MASGPSYRGDMDAAVQMTHVVKAFGPVRALDDLDLHVGQGQIHGLLGPNGSGKTTALRILLGLIRADSGTVRVLGSDAWQDATTVHRRIAYVPGDVSLWPSLTGAEVISLLGGLQGNQHPQRVNELLEEFELDASRRIRTLSKGNRQKVSLVAALAMDADLFLLDEPTIGLDPLKAEVFGRIVMQLRDEGRTVLLSSHILSEVQHLCDHVSILSAGRTVDCGEVTQMRHLAGTTVVAEVRRMPKGIADVVGVASVQGSAPGTVQIHLDDTAMPQVLAALVEAGVTNLTSQPPTLEDLFLRRYRSAGEPLSSAGSPLGDP